MEGLLEFLSANFFIVIFIVVGLLGFLKDKSSKQEEEQKRRPNPQTQRRSDPDPFENQQPERQIQPAAQSNSNQETVPSQSQSQREELAGRLRVNQSEAKQVGSTGNRAKEKSLKSQRGQFVNQQPNNKIGFNKHLSRKEIVNGIVMSEVLGRPRALKPYQSVAQKRTNHR